MYLRIKLPDMQHTLLLYKRIEYVCSLLDESHKLSSMCRLRALFCLFQQCLLPQQYKQSLLFMFCDSNRRLYHMQLKHNLPLLHTKHTLCRCKWTLSTMQFDPYKLLYKLFFFYCMHFMLCRLLPFGWRELHPMYGGPHSHSQLSPVYCNTHSSMYSVHT
jgi:hypothetical protein